MTKIFAIANQKGGVGKTTTTINLSACVAEMGYKTLTIDADPQGNTTSGFGFDKSRMEATLYDALINGVPAAAAVLETEIPKLSVIPSSISLAGAEIEMVSMDRREFTLKNVLAPILAEYDYVFIDCPPSLGLITVNALTACTGLLVPIQCEFYALEGLSQLMNTVRMVKKSLNTGLYVHGVILTMFDARTNLSTQVADEVKKFFKERVYKTVIPRNVRLGEAPSFGAPITKYDPSCIGAEAYRQLGKELVGTNG